MTYAAIYSTQETTLLFVKNVTHPSLLIMGIYQMILLPKSILYFVQEIRTGLLFATIPVYKTIREVETVVASHLDYEKQYLIGDSYDVCRKKIRKLELSSFFCDGHFKEFYFFIMEYIKFRNHFASKRFKNRVLSKADSTVKSKFKLGKLGRLNKI